MKKLIIKVASKSSTDNSTVVSLIKEVNRISCRIFVDIENGLVTVEDVDNSMIDNVMELVDNYYKILSVDIDNTYEEITKEQVIPSINETATEVKPNEVVTKNIELRSKDDLIIKKVEFENEYVESRINTLLKIAYWEMYNKRASEKEIGYYILTCMSEIFMRYSSKSIIEFSVGDIVDVNYGTHLPGEIMGGHVHSVICNILQNKMAYVVPITKRREEISSTSYLFMDAPQDVTYNDKNFKGGGTVLIDKGRYIGIERVNSIVGKTKLEFFEKILYQLKSAFDFTDCLVKTVEEGEDD